MTHLTLARRPTPRPVERAKPVPVLSTYEQMLADAKACNAVMRRDGHSQISPEERRERRAKVGKLAAQGMSKAEIMRELGMYWSAVNRDLKALAKGESA